MNHPRRWKLVKEICVCAAEKWPALEFGRNRGPGFNDTVSPTVTPTGLSEIMKPKMYRYLVQYAKNVAM